MTTYELLARPDAGTWGAFLDHWGAPPRRGGDRARGEPVLPVPALLGEFHSTIPRVQANHLVPLDQLEVDGGMAIVYYEEQGVFLWALREEDLAADDPPVWGRYAEPDDPWRVQAPALSLFLTQIVVLDAVFGCFGGGGLGTHSQVPRAQAERVLAPLAPLPWAPWSWPPQEGRFLAGDRAVGFLTCEEAEGEAWCSAWVAGLDAQALAPFLPLATSDDWVWFDGD